MMLEWAFWHNQDWCINLKVLILSRGFQKYEEVIWEMHNLSTCQEKKSKHYIVQTITSIEAPWEDIGIDFMLWLPRTQQNNDSISIVLQT